jgi:3-hydroxyacyl-CoA dehydrogenase
MKPALEAKVRAGELGRRTGRGWYVYSEEQGT